jgi:biotin synthase
MQLPEITAWLRQADETRLAELWRRADQVRRETVGDAVHLRGLVELSNHCARLCAYCGLRAANRDVVRYRMSESEILACAGQAVSLGYGTVVLQSGEDPGIECGWLAALVRRIKAETPLAVTLSLGERDEQELAVWREAGADRYLLRFETSRRDLYERIHPPRPGTRSDRIALLATLGRFGYEVGSGVMIGIPGQTYEDLARDIDLFRKLDLDMIGVGPYLEHPNTPLVSGSAGLPPARDLAEHPQSGQAPNTELMTYKVIALSRLVCPRANIPATTALATLNLQSGRELGLMRGANVLMPNLTPPQYRIHYEIYPNKACLLETAGQCGRCTEDRVRGIGRSVGRGRGDARRRKDEG